MTPEERDALREPFPANAIGKLPKAGLQLDYVGHAAVTDRLLAVDPTWTWEPFALATDGTPAFRIDGTDAVMWIRLTVCGVTRPGVGIKKANAGDLEKQLVSNALCNAAMRFGVALDLWSKEELLSPEPESVEGDQRRAAAQPNVSASAPAATAPTNGPPAPSANRVRKLKERAAALVAANVPVADTRIARKLPIVDKCDEAQLVEWEQMLDELDAELSAPFVSPGVLEQMAEGRIPAGEAML